MDEPRLIVGNPEAMLFSVRRGPSGRWEVIATQRYEFQDWDEALQFRYEFLTHEEALDVISSAAASFLGF